MRVRLWGLAALFLALMIGLQSFGGQGFQLHPDRVAGAQTITCLGAGVSANPTTVTAPGQVTIMADGFSPGSTVNINVLPPAGWSFSAQAQPTAGSDCRAISNISVASCPGCPSGTATVTASGTRVGGGPVTYTGAFQLIGSQAPSQPSAIPTTAPATCSIPNASVTPSVTTQGGHVTFLATGFSPRTTVSLQIVGPGTANSTTAQADQFCQIAVDIAVGVTDPPGVYNVQATGPAYSPFPTFAPSTLQLSANFQVIGASPTPLGATVTPTSTNVCPTPSVVMASNRLTRGQQTTYSAVGFRPGSMVQVTVEDPSLPSPQPTLPFFVDSQVGPATTTCAVVGTLTPNPTVPVGHYRLSLTGLNHVGALVTARIDFDVVAEQGVPTSTPLPPPPPGATATPTVPPTTPGAPAPVVVQQTLNLIGGARVPVVGQASTYQHVIRVTNTSPQALDSSAIARLFDVIAASLQGSGINMSFQTDYAETSQIAQASANVGRTTVRGTSVIWDGQLQSGESLELTTTFDFTPTTALALNQPIRGQSFSVSDPRGVTLALAPQPLPQLPVAQRVVQPPPPPVDPITGNRYFSETGFGIGDDNMWNYFVRRGGLRTFGFPISRMFVLSGQSVQLFEKGMLAVDDSGNVTTLNLLEDPFLPYDQLGDLSLPDDDPGLIGSAPDPAAPDYLDQVQEFIRVNAAETFDGNPTHFYSTFLGTVPYFDAFFTGDGDPNLLPGFDLEIWGFPTSQPGYRVIGYDVIRSDTPGVPDTQQPVLDTSVVLQRFQRGVMRYDATTGTSTGVPLGPYLRAIIMGQVDAPVLADAASSSPLWAQYNPDAVNWIDRPDDLPDTNLVLAFEPE
ncbi:MAG TPA: hypothetical protein VFC51_08430 [Chloroflexota bacterium]|nr:hypothetical protein [Chloroflexota bacterium]